MTTPASTIPETTLLHLQPEQVASHPDNPRDAVGDVTDLANSIREVGLLEPIIVAPIPDDMASKKYGRAEYLLIAGHRRLAACVVAGVPAPALFRADLTTRAQQIEAMLVENLHRVDLSPIEEGNSYQLLIDITGLTQAKVAEHVGQPAKRIRERIKLTRLPNGVQTRVHDGQITLADAAAIAEFSDEADLVAKVEKAVGSSDYSWTLQNARSTAKKRAEARAITAAVEKAGIPILDEAPEAWRADSPKAYLGHVLERIVSDVPAGGLTTEWVVEHRDEIPGLEVFVNNNGANWYCDRPAAGADIVDTDLPQSPEELDAHRLEEERRETERRERDELQGKLDAAAAVRREHISGILHAGGNDDIAKRVLIRWMLEENNEAGLHWYLDHSSMWPVVAQMLRLAVETERDSRAALVERKLNKLTLPALVLLIATWWTYDNELASTIKPLGRKYGDDEAIVDWVHTLTDDLAYPWSDFERDWIGLDDTGHVPAADDDEDEDEEGAA